MKKRLVIGVDGRAVYRTFRRGTGKNLIDLYRRLSELEPSWKFIFFHQADGENDPFGGRSGLEHRRIDMPGDRFNCWEQIRLPLAALTARVDVLHCPANTGPRWSAAPVVLTVHDLIPLDPEFSTPETRAVWRNQVARSLDRARRVITPSEYTRSKLTEEFGICADKVTVNHWAPDSGCRRITDSVELVRARRAYGLDSERSYVFAFGSGDPRKNTRQLIAAWALLPERLRSEYTLLLAGVQGSMVSSFRRRVQELGLTGGCQIHGFAKEHDLPALISGATLMCYPSLSEGFGLPILDAFACGAPVLAGNVTSIPEVAGDAAMLVDVRNPRAMAEGLRTLLEDSRRRESLIERGKERVSQFTWDACARRLGQVFRDVLEEGR